jgi:hypothetical protein
MLITPLVSSNSSYQITGIYEGKSFQVTGIYEGKFYQQTTQWPH